MSKSSASSTKPAWHVWICMHIHSFISCSFPSANRITSSITTTTSTASSSHGSLLHLALLPSFFLSPPHLSPLSALIHPTHPAQHGEGASHHAVGHSAGVHYGASPAGQAKHAGALHQLLPHPHLPAAHLHHCLANVSGWATGFPLANEGL